MTEQVLNGVSLILLEAEGPLLAGEADALDIVGQTYGTAAQAVVIPVGRLSPSFFKLSTRQAGAFIQKLQNYRLRVIIVGDISTLVAESKSLADFVRETNRTGHHLFVPDQAALAQALR